MGTAVIENYKLMFKKSKTGSYLTVEPKQGAEVPVAVWQLTTDDERSLDRYEGYPKYYYKKEFQVTVTGIKTGKNVNAQHLHIYWTKTDRAVFRQ